MRAFHALAATGVAAAMLVPAAPAGASNQTAQTTIGSKASMVSALTLLAGLKVARENGAGYSRTRFTLWIDADRDKCNTRKEVLIAEAMTTGRPQPELRSDLAERHQAPYVRDAGDIARRPDRL